MDTLSELLADVRLLDGLYYQCELAAPWRLEIPAAEGFSFCIVTEGQLAFRRPDSPAVTVRPGEMMVVQPGTPYWLGDDPEGPGLGLNDAHALSRLGPVPFGEISLGGDGSRTRFVFGRGRLQGSGEGLARALPPVLHMPAPLGNQGAWQTLLPMLIRNGTQDNRPGRAAMVNRICELVWTEAIRAYVSELPDDCRGWLRAINDRYLSSALGRMHANPEHPWTVPELACLVGLSRSAFAARFVEVMQESTQAYLTRHRMSMAARWLEHGGLPVADIARRVGYNAETAFSQAFKREMGMSPSQWRNLHRRKDTAAPTAA